MKIQKQLAYRYKDKPYYKHVLVLPRTVVEELGWDAVEKLEFGIEGHRLVLEPTVVDQKDPQDLKKEDVELDLRDK